MRLIAGLLILAGCASAQTNGSAMPFVKPYWTTNGGLPAANYRMCFWNSGTTVPATTYTTSGLSVPNTNPVILDSSGRANIFFAAQSYKVALLLPTSTTTDCIGGTMSAIWTEDNIANNADLLKLSNGAGLVGFSQSSSYPSGTVGKKLQQAISITDAPYNANCNGVADTTAAFNLAVSSLGASGGEILIPANSICNTTTGWVVTLNSSQYIRVVGQGNSSVIQCTGVACVTWTGAGAQASGMQDLTISDPIGNSSTIGLYVNGGASYTTNLSFSNMRILGNSNLQAGGYFAGLGIGVENKASTLTRFDNVAVAYFNTAVLEVGVAPYYFSSSYWTKCYMYGSGSIGWDINSTGDHSASQCDFEGNTGTGVMLDTYAQSVAIENSHFESNYGNEVELAGTGSQLVSSANNYEGGTALIDTGGIFISNPGDNLGTMALTVNSTGGLGLPGATINNPIFGPSAMTGTGCVLYTMKGTIATYGSGCGSIPYSISGFATYAFGGTAIASTSSSGGLNPSFQAVDTNTAATSACYGFVSKVTAYLTTNPLICWDTGVGGFDFLPNVAISGGVDYNFRNGAGGSIGTVDDAGTWSIHKLQVTQLPTSCGALPTGTIWNNSGTLGVCP